MTAEISKHTPDDHTDKPALERAIVAVAQAASMLDSSVARHHNQMQVMKVRVITLCGLTLSSHVPVHYLCCKRIPTTSLFVLHHWKHRGH